MVISKAKYGSKIEWSIGISKWNLNLIGKNNHQSHIISVRNIGIKKFRDIMKYCTFCQNTVVQKNNFWRILTEKNRSISKLDFLDLFNSPNLHITDFFNRKLFDSIFICQETHRHSYRYRLLQLKRFRLQKRNIYCRSRDVAIFISIQLKTKQFFAYWLCSLCFSDWFYFPSIFPSQNTINRHLTL